MNFYSLVWNHLWAPQPLSCIPGMFSGSMSRMWGKPLGSAAGVLDFWMTPTWRSLNVSPELGSPVWQHREGREQGRAQQAASTAVQGSPEQGWVTPMDKPTGRQPLHRAGSVKVQGWNPRCASSAGLSRTGAWLDFMLLQKLSVQEVRVSPPSSPPLPQTVFHKSLSPPKPSLAGRGSD